MFQFTRLVYATLAEYSPSNRVQLGYCTEDSQLWVSLESRANHHPYESYWANAGPAQTSSLKSPSRAVGYKAPFDDDDVAEACVE